MKSTDFLACFIIEISSFVIIAKFEAQNNAWSSKFSEIDGWKSTMSNEIKLCLCFSLMLSNHLITFWVFFHWFKFRIFLKLELALSRMILHSFPDSLFAGLISRHFGLFPKFSLWSLREINVSRFFICSIRSPIPKLFKICFSSSSICEMVPSDPCLHVFGTLSCTNVLHVIDKHFPPNHKLHKIFNRNTVKVSYSCMNNVKSR